MNEIEVKYIVFNTCSFIFPSICILFNCIIVTIVIIVVKIKKMKI